MVMGAENSPEQTLNTKEDKDMVSSGKHVHRQSLKRERCPEINEDFQNAISEDL